MALYRFLFAPALLAVAVLAGPGDERERPLRAEAPRVIAPAPRPASAQRLEAAPLERAVAAKQAPRRARPAKPAR